MPLSIEEALTLDNIAEVLSETELTTIFNEVESGYTEDKESRAEWETRQDEYMKLALQVAEKKNTPWENAANVKYPLLTTATMQFGARAYPGLVTGPNIVKGRVTGFDPTGSKALAAERVGKHMSYQLIEEMDGWEDDMDKMCVSIPIVGCMFKKTYYSPSKGTNVSELVYPKHLVVNYWTKTLQDAPRITHKIFLYDNDIYERINSGLFLDQEYHKTYIEGDTAANEAHGVHEPQVGESTPHGFYEQHTWLDLDEDGYKEPYIVTFNDDKVARIVAAYDEDTIVQNGAKIIRIGRIEYFTKYGFVPSPDGSFYDIGFGLLLGPINDSINTTINQLHDAGTMATRAGGFLGRGAKIKGGRHKFKPFEWQNLQSGGDDIKKNVMPLPVREPSPVLFSLLGLLIDAGKELSSTVPMMLGQNPGQNQPATTSLAVVEQGSKVFSAVFKRLHRSLKQELKKLKRLNRLYLPPEAYFKVLDPKPEPVLDDMGQPVLDQSGNPMTSVGSQEKIFQLDYSDDETDVQPYSDPSIVSETQRMIKAQQIENMLAQGVIPNPNAGVSYILEAMDLPNIEEFLTPPEPQPNPEFELEQMKVQGELQIKSQLAMADIALKDAQVGNLETQAMLNLAKAQQIGDDTEIRVYEAQIKELKERREGFKALLEGSRDDSRSMERMEGESGN